MKSFINFSIIFLVLTFSSFAQTQGIFQSLEEGDEISQNGFTVSYQVLNKRERQIRKKGTYDRYEIRFDLSNHNSCGFSQPFDQFTQGKTKIQAPIVAQIVCKNATGYKFTSTGTNFSMGVKYLNYKRLKSKAERAANRSNNNDEDDERQNYENIRVPTGYFWAAGERKQQRMIIIVPKGEKPEFEFKVNPV